MPKPSRRATTTAFIAATGTVLIALGAALFRRRSSAATGEHTAPDLALNQRRPGPADRAPAAFRPDPTAIPTADEREALRPATGPAPAFASDRGITIGEPVDAA